jgi:hypothetical protein
MWAAALAAMVPVWTWPAQEIPLAPVVRAFPVPPTRQQSGIAKPSTAAATHQQADAMAYFAGRWRCSGHFEPSMKPLASMMEFSADLDADIMIKHHRDQPPGQYVADEFWGYARGAGVFRATIADTSNGVRWYVSRGWEGDKWIWSRERVSGEPPERFDYTKVSDDRMQVEWWRSRAGAPLAVGDMLTCDRS